MLERWKERNLTLFGKIVILKTLAISQIVYNLSLLEIRPETIKHINKSMFSFLWHSRDRIKRNVLIGEYENGGLKMIDIECKIKSPPLSHHSPAITPQPFLFQNHIRIWEI